MVGNFLAAEGILASQKGPCFIKSASLPGYSTPKERAPVYRWLGVPQSRSVLHEEEKYLLSLPGIETWLVSRPASSPLLYRLNHLGSLQSTAVCIKYFNWCIVWYPWNLLSDLFCLFVLCRKRAFEKLIISFHAQRYRPRNITRYLLSTRTECYRYIDLLCIILFVRFFNNAVSLGTT
jgi:hypothetical protein